MDSRQRFFVGEEPRQQRLPVRKSSMLQHKFERDVFREHNFGRAHHRYQALSLFCFVMVALMPASSSAQLVYSHQDNRFRRSSP